MLFLSNGPLSPRLKFTKICLNLLDKKMLKIVFRRSASFGKGLGVLNIFRELCFRISHFQVTVAYKTVAHKKCGFETDPT